MKHIFIIIFLLPLCLCAQKPVTDISGRKDSIDYKLKQLDNIFSADTIVIVAVSTGEPFTEQNTFSFYRSGTLMTVDCISIHPYEANKYKICDFKKQLDAKQTAKLKALLIRGIRLDSDLYGGCSTRKDFSVSSKAGLVSFKDLQCSSDDIWKPLKSLIKLTCH